MSADEEPGEGPRFVKPLQDTTATAGSEVKLDCIVTGKPPITGTAQSTCWAPTNQPTNHLTNQLSNQPSIHVISFCKQNRKIMNIHKNVCKQQNEPHSLHIYADSHHPAHHFLFHHIFFFSLSDMEEEQRRAAPQCFLCGSDRRRDAHSANKGAKGA